MQNCNGQSVENQADMTHVDYRSLSNNIVFGLVLLHLDYSNAILAKLPDNAVSKMQRVQNIASCIVLYDEKDSSTT